MKFRAFMRSPDTKGVILSGTNDSVNRLCSRTVRWHGDGKAIRISGDIQSLSSAEIPPSRCSVLLRSSTPLTTFAKQICHEA